MSSEYKLDQQEKIWSLWLTLIISLSHDLYEIHNLCREQIKIEKEDTNGTDIGDEMISSLG